MDVVYPFRDWPNNSIELRYSLRSLQNIDHGKVFIIWSKPDWINNIIHIQAEDNTWSKYLNVINKYKMICEDPRISEDFILMNDDIYINKKIDKIQIYTKWTLLGHMEYIINMYGPSRYWEIMNKVYQIYPKWYSYNTHTPMIYNKKKLKEVLDEFWSSEISVRSIYWNKYDIESTEYKIWDVWDCKIYKIRDVMIEYLKDKIYISSDDKISRYVYFEAIMKTLFPNKSKYEAKDHKIDNDHVVIE